jgi:uncharacterized integral membrane protein
LSDEKPEFIRSTNDRIGIGAIITVIVVVVVGTFVYQNRDTVEIEFLFLGIRLPLWAVIAIFVLLGVLLGWVWRRVMRRRAGKRTSSG